MSSSEYGIVYQLAPELGVRQWRGAAGQPLPDYRLAAMPGRYKLLFCFQHNCPGCHRCGFPTLIKLYEAFRDSKTVSFACEPRHAAHRNPLQRLRRPLGPRLPRRPGAQQPALLHQRAGSDEVRLAACRT